MKRFKQILVATDLSSESLSTARYAAHLAKAQNAALTIVHVPQITALLFPYYDLPIDLAGLDTELEATARKKLDAFAKRFVKEGVRTRVVVRRGTAHEIICAVATEIGASVIVMATHGRKGFGHVLLGSVTENVLREAPCPVLVVRPPAPAIQAKQAA